MATRRNPTNYCRGFFCSRMRLASRAINSAPCKPANPTKILEAEDKKRAFFIVIYLFDLYAFSLNLYWLCQYASADSRLIWQGAAPLQPFLVPYMRPVALFRALYVPCGSFRRFICARRPFPTLFICTRWHFLFASLRPSVRVCVCKSPKRFLNARTQKFSKCTKNREKIHRRSHDYFRRIRFIITGGMN